MRKHGITLDISNTEKKQELLKGLDIADRMEADKVDVILLGEKDGEEVFLGVVHVKASFAERRTEDVPMSRALIKAGYLSPFWTMDCKSQPSANPVNKGELGKPGEPRAKRKDIESDAYFSGCFSYNSNTVPTPEDKDTNANVYVLDFNDPDDAFSQLIIEHWRRLQVR